MGKARWAAGMACVVVLGAGIGTSTSVRADRPAEKLSAESPADARTGTKVTPPSGYSLGQGGPDRLHPVDPAALPLPARSPQAPAPTAQGIGARLAPLLRDPALGGRVGVVVVDGSNGSTVYADRGTVPLTPASATKLITAAAVTSVVPAGTTLDTRVVRGRAPHQIVLVAGGDTLLAPGAGSPDKIAGRAGLADLADQVAQTLRSTPDGQQTPVTLAVDEGSLAGPRIDPSWDPGDVRSGYAGAVTPLNLTTYRPREGGPAGPADPTLATATALKAALTNRGITVTGPITRTAAATDAEQLGLVRSAPVTEQLALALTESDNTLTAALARIGAVKAGVSPTFSAVAEWITRRMGELGLPAEGLRVVDASGLAAGTTATAATMAATVARGTTGASPELSRVIAGLPVAGLTGTLAARFAGPESRNGVGLVRAKTGTLTGVSSLAGTVVDADGRLLVFATLADKVPASGTQEARAALDRIAAALADCGCR
ncbi:Carboxypeptidase [Austwickia sp. TVS 96-490-7B]|uniref:D-alanyl-D-alanine carboxypeptidase/D-alanyl-D-alanine-endopeptidase n=1 Tax=Austwickia sp. TVS 96-490-7B TaxID=2830843 RepID=UPI001C594189|nr:D-alanyl-D-alanine carboxypeptidase [Austwickia sp. TVS 96-490-7B]MBW3084838.1 Carboxypeptidase [Austwickia sp. TVS 96-490-7B]